MDLILYLVAGAAIALVVLGAAAWLVWRRATAESRSLVKRLARLPFRAKLRLARGLLRDGRIPLPVRAILPALVLYLALPLDIVPDFIPVLGQLDDVLVLVIGVGLLLRFTPRSLLEEHLSGLEST